MTVWVPRVAVISIHDRQIARHGGAPGARDLSLLDAGLARPLNLAAYGDPSLVDLAAAYAFGVVKAHAFVDGNKRTGFVTAVSFLRLNGEGFRPDTMDGVRMMEGLASGDVTEQGFAAWLSAGITPLSEG